MIEAQRENLSINKLIAEKKEIIFAEGDMIVPDSKPDILNTISTSGVVSIYKKEIQSEKVRLDGTVNAYIMYMPDGADDTVRGLNTSVDFSENLNIPNCQEGMEAISNIKIKSIEAKVINGRKIGIKATLEVNLKIYSNEEVEIINEIQNEEDVQILKEDLKLNSLVGTGTTKIYAKDNIQIDSMDNLAEILQAQVCLVDKDIKISYNKVLTKAEAEIKIMYLTEDNRINVVTYKIPVVGFIDIADVSEENICDVNYEIKNIIIKPNSQDEHSIYVEIEIEVTCCAYEEKQINLIQDMYSPTQNLTFEKKQITTMTSKQNVTNVKQIREKINLNDIQGLNLLDVETVPTIINENKINTKIMYEAELNMKFIFENSQKQINIKDAKIPFEYTIENLQNGEMLNTNCDMGIKSQDFIIQDGGDINCNIDVQADTSMYRTANLNMIDSIQEDGEREEQDYSLVIYIVKKGDTLWNIRKKLMNSKIYSRPRIKIPPIFSNNIGDKNLKRKQKIVKIFIIMVIAFSTVKIVLDAILPIFDTLCKDKAKSIATIISNEEATNVMKEHTYDELFTLEKDKDGNITMIKSNIIAINEIISDVAVKIQNTINQRGRENIEIALGSFTGFKLLSGKGPGVPIKISSIGNVETDLRSEFSEKGINQTLHRVYLQVDCEVSILTPYNSITEKVSNQVLLIENVIVGKIPSTYYNLEGFDSNSALEIIE